MRFRRAKKPVEENGLSDREIRRVFQCLDVDRTGSIDRSTLREGLKGLGLRPSRSATETLWLAISEHDADKSGNISFEEFVSFARWRERELYRIFDELDRNNDGSLCVPEIVRALRSYGIEASHESVTSLLLQPRELADRGGSRAPDAETDLTFDEFQRLTLLLPSVRIEEIFSESAEVSVVEMFFSLSDLSTLTTTSLLPSPSFSVCYSHTHTRTHTHTGFQHRLFNHSQGAAQHSWNTAPPANDHFKWWSWWTHLTYMHSPRRPH